MLYAGNLWHDAIVRQWLRSIVNATIVDSILATNYFIFLFPRSGNEMLTKNFNKNIL